MTKVTMTSPLEEGSDQAKSDLNQTKSGQIWSGLVRFKPNLTKTLTP